ncbi:hypothetical protein Rsub_03434 [Raphidocelis subcapitata]|uniref:MYND-type domain-containing protein n=1 Tax=Raphidocelis subcapitata TaxID=307507 RepID=A0A2V0NRZ2_9CHLO|nr:hypothetical protein Rsub_03434 [Raphidocelis subcapitata]|eukprot:GBF90438.1 hypothetical protein Rsub_03434 [Raphidocelis subcapitata]
MSNGVAAANGAEAGEARKHRELVASAASAKAALRALAAAAAQKPAQDAAAAAAAAERAAAAVDAVRALLGGALDAANGDGLQRLPLDTSRRLVEIDLPAAWAALLDAAPLRGAAADVAAATADALAMLAATALRACARATDPLDLLLQLAAAPLMAACARRLDGLRAAAEAAGVGSEAAAHAVRAAAALSAPYAVVAAVAGGHNPVFEELHSRLAASLGATGFLGAACSALLTAASARARSSDGSSGGSASSAGDDGAAALTRACERASDNLLTLALFLSGADCAGAAAAAAGGGAPRTGAAPMAASEAHAEERAAEGLPAWSWKPSAGSEAPAPKAPCSCAGPLPPGGLSVALGACGRAVGNSPAAACEALNGSDSPLGSAGHTPPRWGTAQHSPRAEAGCAGCAAPGGHDALDEGYDHDAPLPAMLAALSAPAALAFLEERAAHALRDMPCGRAAADAAITPAAFTAARGLLPGRASGAPNGAAVVALRVLVCWRALLRGGMAAVRSALAAPGGVAPALMAALLFAAAPQQAGGRASGAGAVAGSDALGARCTVAAGECLLFAVERVMASSGKNAEGLRALLPVVAGGAASAALAAAGAWERQQRLGRGQELPYSGQLKCAERGAGEALRCQCQAAGMAADAMYVLLSAQIDGGGSLATVAVLIPALEALFRRVPAASGAHTSAALLLSELLPAHAAELMRTPGGDGGAPSAAPSAAVVSVLVTLRKFLTRCAGLQGQDRTDAEAVGVACAGLLACLLHGAAASALHGRDGPAGALATFAAAQLLPGLQALATGLLKTGGGHALAREVASVLAQAVSLHAFEPDLGLVRVALAHGGLSFCTVAAAAAPAAGEGLAAAALAVAEAFAAADGVAAGVLPALLQSRALPELQRALAALAATAHSGGPPAAAAAPSAAGVALSRKAFSSSAASLHALGRSASIAVGELSLHSSSGTGSGGAWPLSRQLSSPSPHFYRTDSSGVLGGSAPTATTMAPWPRLGGGGRSGRISSSSSFVSATEEAPAAADKAGALPPSLRALQARLDALALRLAAAALAACDRRGAAQAGDDGPTAAAASAARPYTGRPSADEALASLRVAVATAPAPLPPAGLGVLDSQLSGSAASLTLEGLSPRNSDGLLPLFGSSGSLDGAALLAAAAAAAADDAAAPALPLPADRSRRLLRALAAAAPAVVKAAGPAAAAALDAAAAWRALPSAAALRVGCSNPACVGLAGASEAAAPLKPCAGGCGSAAYCSRACANAAFAAHRAECGAERPAAARADGAGAAP